MNAGDTIVAISSAPGVGARCIVRTSGPDAWRAFASLHARPDDVAPANGSPTAARSAVISARLSFASLVCPAFVYIFQAPNSYTGDDLVEYHLPGNAILAGLLVSHLTTQGLRPAEAGEFTARAYFAGKIDLTAAEGVASLVSAQSEQEMVAARRLLAGELARRLAPPMDRLFEALALLEVGIDFSDEEVTFLPPEQLRLRVDGILAELRTILLETGRFERLAHEPTFVLVGRPNAGKSTLLNALSGQARAVTSPTAGTTRDALSTEVVLRRGVVRVWDVAGLETPVDESSDSSSVTRLIERRMQSTAFRAIEQADFLVLVLGPDESSSSGLYRCPRRPDLVVHTKSDLYPALSGHDVSKVTSSIDVSALTGAGVVALKDALDRLAYGRNDEGNRLNLNVRHVGAIGQAISCLEKLSAEPNLPTELVAAEMRDALSALGSILGQLTPDDLLGKIFSRFCIGK